MRLGLRIFFCYLLVFALCFAWPYDWVLDSLRIRYYESVEEVLIDEANILTALVAQSLHEGRFAADSLQAVFDQVHARRFSARIYEVEKKRVDQRVYITDRAGRILFDSRGIAREGDDYSRWIDVQRTLRGEYGARTSKMSSEEGELSVFHVAAPIMVAGELVGVLTVAKPTTATHNFMLRAKSQLYRVAGAAAAAVFVLSLLVALWVTRPIKRLTAYAHAVRRGERPAFPRLDRTEIGEMGQAFEKMREALEGKKYVERYIQTLTHEIKSPLSAILGAIELLKEKMDETTRRRFLANIEHESSRIKALVERMLELAALENRTMLGRKGPVPLPALVRTVLESQQAAILLRQLQVQTELPQDLTIAGDGFLLHQALENLVQNAVDFSPPRGLILVQARTEQGQAVLTVDNEGSHIPDYAQARIFERFFSLARPGTGKKSTGLGLNLVREVAALHQGTITLHNRSGGGVRATLTLPLPG
ncbi:MAG: two-component system sensor histidine kinase CreC [Desulfobulbaceae bacterium A2]|nr:MAG: two-component system sensor histidine kinase CreC [Desulfobulbaceae bacterium A2]